MPRESPWVLSSRRHGEWRDLRRGEGAPVSVGAPTCRGDGGPGGRWELLGTWVLTRSRVGAASVFVCGVSSQAGRLTCSRLVNNPLPPSPCVCPPGCPPAAEGPTTPSNPERPRFSGAPAGAHPPCSFFTRLQLLLTRGSSSTAGSPDSPLQRMGTGSCLRGPAPWRQPVLPGYGHWQSPGGREVCLMEEQPTCHRAVVLQKL